MWSVQAELLTVLVFAGALGVAVFGVEVRRAGRERKRIVDRQSGSDASPGEGPLSAGDRHRARGGYGSTRFTSEELADHASSLTSAAQSERAWMSLRPPRPGRSAEGRH